MSESITRFNYPNTPGWKAPGTSQAAAIAETSRAKPLRERVYQLLLSENLTADECAARLQSTEFAIRPRLSELRALGKIFDSGIRRANLSGHQAVVWSVFAPKLKQAELI